MTISHYAKGALVTFLGVLIISPDTLLIRLISADQWTTLFWRGLLPGLVIFLGLALIHGRDLTNRIHAVGKPGIWIAVVFGSGSIFFMLAVINTTVANVLFIISISPLFSALISKFVLHNEISNKTWIAIAAALTGISVIAWGSFTTMDGSSLVGDLMAVMAAICMSITFTIIHQYRDIDMIPAMGGANLFAAIIVLPLADPFSVSGQDILWIGLLGLLVIPISFTLLTIGPRYLPAPEVGLFLLLEAVLGPYWVWIVINEHPGDMTVIGGAVVLGTLLMLNLTDILKSKLR
jgi:drug/metabolite transporter (DMT)-like permease